MAPPAWRAAEPAVLDQRAAHGGAHAPAVAVARRRWRIAFVAVIAGMWWWGFDFGQILGGFNRKEIEQRIATLEADAAQLRSAKPAELRARNTAARERARDDARRAGDAARSSRPSSRSENAQLKDELAFLQQLVADSSKSAGAGDPAPRGRAATATTSWRYSVLIVRGGSPKDDFDGQRRAAGRLLPTTDARSRAHAARPSRCPSDEPGRRAAAEAQIQVLSTG